MQEWELKPLGIGRLLDRSFQVYRNHFSKLFLLGLILLGPYYLIQNFGFSSGNMPFLPSFDTNNPWKQFFQGKFQPSMGPVGPIGPPPTSGLIGSFILFLIYIYGLIPICLASVFTMVDSIVKGIELSWKEVIGVSVKRFFPLLGNCLLYSLFFIVGWVAVAVGTLILSLISTIVVGSLYSPVLMVLGGIVAILAGFGLFIGLSYFLIRFGFFLPPVMHKREGLGLGTSWNLTEGSFWRLLGIFVTLLVVYNVFLISTGVSDLFGPSVLMEIISILLNLALIPILMVTYAVTYIDLKIRREGLDIQEMMARMIRDREQNESSI